MRIALVVIALLAFGLAVAACLTRAASPADASSGGVSSQDPARASSAPGREVVKTDEEWRKQLTAEQYHVTREAGTEPAYTGKYWNNHEKGIYRCVDCNL